MTPPPDRLDGLALLIECVGTIIVVAREDWVGLVIWSVGHLLAAWLLVFRRQL